MKPKIFTDNPSDDVTDNPKEESEWDEPEEDEPETEWLNLDDFKWFPDEFNSYAQKLLTSC